MDQKSGQEVWDPDWIERSKLVEVEGVTLVSGTAENWSRLWAFAARPDDLLICTYPKAGTTWIQEIVDMVQHGGDPQKCARAPMQKRMPFIDLFLPKPMTSGLEDAEGMPSPRTMKTHLPAQLLPPSFWEQNCKIIYVARNAKDSAVSYFHFHRMNQGMPEPGNWDQFLEAFLVGKVACGSWFDHVRGWWEAKKWHPILYLFYEDMKEDPAREIQKVAQFLGIELTAPVLKRIVQHTTFESMKDNPMANYSTLPTFFLDQGVSPFMRKGVVGDWKVHFTVAQSERLDEICAQKLESSGLVFRTEP
ncbi:sulfotransferase 1C2-like [Sphaerodactylus townsendi]|uniref:Sulfotransferase 1C2 n=1 Tax=Sphaerodactylus townsendi TaxID=933632 RepID=A0ACB8EV61_9SAUR|nr:sulfotransferase 1C2-like [Sphaerodactylus townsendi]XP_048373594.1 sulfotransferase 1C2-like [Sphaerodactylus townsendi]XP_048373595.1 sulfotransferase 1C2-like [Sphaerodactylus townsendi]XP_048373596.1 sulfotransferase 1C2-like [Sphaerodactylus townsendi]